MSRVVPLLGLGLIAVGVLYWRKGQTKTPAEDATASSDTPPTSANTPTATTGGAASSRPDGGMGSAGVPRRIKGNVHGERKLYHLPEDDSYDHVLEERLFATVEEAKAAGFRHAGHTPN